MKFSLIVATVNRTKELEKLFSSLAVQEFTDFEIVVVDQNENDSAAEIVAKYKNRMTIQYIRAAKGLSKARNVGIQQSRGEILAFPDDDCWYEPDFLAQIDAFFNKNEQFAGVTGRTVSEHGVTCAANFDNRAGKVNANNVWIRGNSASLFLRQEVVRETGLFDEKLGVGAGSCWESGEETDYLLRVLAAGHMIYYNPALTVGHPEPIRLFDEAAIRRAYRYAPGMGFVLKKHRYSIDRVAYYCLRPLIGSIWYLIRGQSGRARYHWVVFLGRVWGYTAVQ